MVQSTSELLRRRHHHQLSRLSVCSDLRRSVQSCRYVGKDKRKGRDTVVSRKGPLSSFISQRSGKGKAANVQDGQKVKEILQRSKGILSSSISVGRGGPKGVGSGECSCVASCTSAAAAVCRRYLFPTPSVLSKSTCPFHRPCSPSSALLQVLLLHSIAPTATCAAPCPSPARLPRPRIAVGPVPNNVERLKGLAPVHTHAALFLFLSIISISVQPHPSKIIAPPSSLYLHFPSPLHCIACSSKSRLAQPCLVLHSAQSHLNCTPRTHIHSRQRRILLVK